MDRCELCPQRLPRRRDRACPGLASAHARALVQGPSTSLSLSRELLFLPGRPQSPFWSRFESSFLRGPFLPHSSLQAGLPFLKTLPQLYPTPMCVTRMSLFLLGCEPCVGRRPAVRHPPTEEAVDKRQRRSLIQRVSGTTPAAPSTQRKTPAHVPVRSAASPSVPPLHCPWRPPGHSYNTPGVQFFFEKCDLEL